MASRGDQGTGAKQAFVWTGGQLSVYNYVATNLTSVSGAAYAGNVGTLTNGGGILAPGDIGTAGKTIVTGNYAVTSANASLAIDIGGTTQANTFQNGSGNYDYLSYHRHRDAGRQAERRADQRLQPGQCQHLYDPDHGGGEPLRELHEHNCREQYSAHHFVQWFVLVYGDL